VLGSEPERFVHQDCGDPAGGDCLVDDEDVVRSAGNAVGLPGSPILERKAVLVDASQSRVEIGHDLWVQSNKVAEGDGVTDLGVGCVGTEGPQHGG
jgi:hypothetical protein